MMLLKIADWQGTSYLMLNSLFHSISLSVVWGKFCVLINEIHDLIDFGMNFNLPFVFVTIVDAGMSW